mgnify:FL=1
MKIIKNALPKEEFLKIQNLLESDEIPWYYNKEQVEKKDVKQLYDGYTSDNESYFSHQFYSNDMPSSSFYTNILPLINFIKPISLINVRANLNVNKNRINFSGWHRDMYRNNKFNHNTAIFYINTNNGYTELKNNRKINSEDNKLLIFDSKELHRAHQQTDTDRRVVINLNYF